MVDGLHIPNSKRNLSIALSVVGRRLRGRNDGSEITNVRYKSNWNCHYEFPHV
jgi:hypothetical protein